MHPVEDRSEPCVASRHKPYRFILNRCLLLSLVDHLDVIRKILFNNRLHQAKAARGAKKTGQRYQATECAHVSIQIRGLK